MEYANIVSFNLAIKLYKNTGINKEVIQLLDSGELPYGPIYTLGLVNLETLKAYTKTRLKKQFIRPSKLTIGAPI